MIMKTRIVVVTSAKEKTSVFLELIANMRDRILSPKVGVTAAGKDDLRQILEQVFAGETQRIIVIPLCLSSDEEFIRELKILLQQMLKENPGVGMELVLDYVSELVLEDMLWESITSRITDVSLLPESGVAIEKLSHRIIDTRLFGCADLSRAEKVVARRIIHSTADYSFADSLRFSSSAVAAGVTALKDKRPVFCDVNMLRTAMTKVPSEVVCLIAEPEVAALAKEMGCTRAAASMMLLGDKLNGAIVVVGNAPTAIWQLLKMEVKPALVIGLPVGFVGARESKLALIGSDHEYIANVTPKGGSPAAAAAMNALALLASEGE